MFEPGFRLDRYELLCKIGQGGMATVWLARTHNSHDEERLVAIKTILPHLAADETLRSMLLDEARIVQGIDHPNVAATLEVGQFWDTPYLVLEYVEGESVEELCKTLQEIDLPIPAAVVVRIIADAALGLHEAHELVGRDGDSLGIVHRDIAPANILVDGTGLSRVIDFGVAKAAERFTPETAAGVMKGRVPYMAPEHASGDPVDRRADIWSLGAVAYYMLAGRYPFDGPNDAARLIKILGTDDPEPLPDSVSPGVRDVIMRALNKDPDGRYETAADLATALELSKLPATHLEVAQFFSETLATSIRDRHALVENALAAADARARAREMLDGPMAAGSSYRPPPVAPLPQVVNPPVSGGTLGTVTRSHRPTVKPWVPWATASAIALIVITAFALGSLTGRGPTGGSANALGSGDASGESAKADADARARAEAEAKAKANADADAKARARAESEAAEAKAAAEAKFAAEAKADAGGAAALPDPKPLTAKTSGPKYTWPQAPATAPTAKGASSASKPSASKPTATATTVTPTKPPEDTIY
jgi:serine/threonine protein kinase